MEKLVIAGREFTSRLFLGTGKFDSNDPFHHSFRNGNGDGSHETYRTGRQGGRHAEAYRASRDTIIAEHVGCPECRRSRVRRPDGTRGIRHELVEVGNSSRPALFVARFHGDPEGHGAVGEVGLCRIALLSGRSYALQTSGRSRSGHSHAFGSTHRDKQGIADP